MIITSDNVCTQIVLERLETEALNAYCRAIGMAHSHHGPKIPPLTLAYDHPIEQNAYTAPHDQGVLLELILRGSQGDAAAADTLGCSVDLCRMGLEFLTWQQHRNLIPSLLPYTTVVANKTGRGRRGRMDAGIVFRDGRPIYILTGFTDFVPETMPDGLPGYVASFNTIGRLSRACWEMVGRS
jgi:beta-lactamase class A